MPVRSRVRSSFPKPANVVWDYLVYLKACEQWMQADELDGVALLFDGGRYAGFQWDPKRPGVEAIVSRVQRIDPGRSVQYRTVHANERNIPPESRAGFPFHSMTQSMSFTDNATGCELVHDFELDPRGPFGWLACKFLVLPYAKRGVVRSHRRLAELLDAV